VIVPVIGAPGTGKTTVLHEVAARHGTPHFELSWMPEFLRMNGAPIAYEADETIAISALLAVGKAYVAGGHRVVFVGDFRLDSLAQVEANLMGVRHQVVRLVCSDPDLLSARILDPDRSSGYRDVGEAIRLNAIYASMEAGDHIVIDVAGASVDDVVRVLEDQVLGPSSALRAEA